MANRLIGVEIAPGKVRVAVLGQHRGTATVIALEQRPYAEAGELPGLLAGMIPGGFQLADLVCTALPAGQSYVRTLQFPFRERRKILAAAPFELAARLPVSMEECQTAVLTPRETADGAQVVAAAVPRASIDALLAPFDQDRTPLNLIDLMPYALAGGLSETIETAVLVCITEREAIVACISAGQIADYRHFPLSGDEVTAEVAAQLCREAAGCQSRLEVDYAPVLLIGALATPLLLGQFREQGMPAELLTLRVGHREIAPDYLPAVALALRAGKKVDDRCFNLRQGQYAYRGEAAALKKTLYGFGGLLGLSVLIFGLSLALDYREKSRQADALLQQMTRQYRETFPGSAIMTDIPLQMQSKLQELRNRAAALGIDTPPQMLPILKELSAVTASTPFEVEDLSCDAGACSLTGSADNFDAVNRIKEQLDASARFGKIEVSETRKAIDGNRVEFRLRLPLLAGGERP
ncbi:MAG: hypothetical protein FIB02_05540 [Desulfuromonas sp.]|nr:hypothetical protein [Desulfuromonas sp.]